MDSPCFVNLDGKSIRERFKPTGYLYFNFAGICVCCDGRVCIHSPCKTKRSLEKYYRKSWVRRTKFAQNQPFKRPSRF